MNCIDCVIYSIDDCNHPSRHKTNTKAPMLPIAAAILKRRVLPDIARKTIEASTLGSRFFSVNTQNGIKLMRYVDPADILETSSPSQLSS
jgi:hypothetical protein